MIQNRSKNKQIQQTEVTGTYRFRLLITDGIKYATQVNSSVLRI